MSAHVVRAAGRRSRLLESGESVLMRLAFAAAGAAVTAGIAGVVALASW
jgi:hypothetical protein